MDPVPGTAVTFPDPNNLMHFVVRVRPMEGLYGGGEFVFNFTVPPTYPFDPPKVHCDTLVLFF